MTKKPLKISLITPSFNGGKYLEETIQSVLSQKYPYLEYIVMDGGSTDNTLDILKKYEKKIFWHSNKDNGQSDALNQGFKKASGDIIGFINSDDVLLPGALKTIARVFASDNNCQWLTGRCYMIDNSGKEIRPLITFYKNFFLSHYHYQMLFIINFISQPATFWKKKLLDDKKIGLFDEKLRYSMDYDFWLRLAKYYPPKILPDYLASYRIHATSKGGSDAKEQFLTEHRIAQKYTNSPFLYFLHYLHVGISILIYTFLKPER